MNADMRDVQLGKALERAVAHIQPDPEVRLSEIRRRGRARRTVRWTAILSALAVALGAVAWAAGWVRESQGDFVGAGTRIELPYANDYLHLPPGWHGTTGNGMNVVALFVSTDPNALSGLVRGCRPSDDSCQIDNLPGPELDADDAFVQVVASFVPAPPEMRPPPLPGAVVRDSFQAAKEFLGEPVWVLTGTGRDRGMYRITFWVGPHANPSDVSEIDSILSRLRLPVSRGRSEAAEQPSRLNASPIGEGWSLYHDQLLNWSLEFPTGWHVQPFNEQCRISWHGIVVANVKHLFRPPDTLNEPPGQEGVTVGCAASWDMRSLPSNMVIVEVRHFEGGPSPVRGEEPDTRFPLSIEAAEPVTIPPEHAYGAPQPHLSLPFQLGGDARYSITVWFGPEASGEDRAAVQRIVATLRIQT